MKTSSLIPPNLKTKFKNADIELQFFMNELLLKISKLQKQKAKIEVENIELKTQIKALKHQLKESKPTIIMRSGIRSSVSHKVETPKVKS